MAENKKNEENLASMSLGDHLEELRARMILMIIGIVVGLAVGMLFGKTLINLLEAPYYRAMQKIYKKDADKLAEHQSTPSNKVKITITKENNEMLQSLKPGDSFWAEIEFPDADPNHPGEAQNRLFFPERMGGTSKGLQTINPAEGFLMYLKVSLVFGIILTSPWLFWQIWAFVSAGLYRHERRFVHVVSPVSAMLFMIGSIFFLLVIAPLVMNFFIQFNKSLSVESNWTLQNYMNMVLLLALVFGLAFQSPIAIVFSERMGLVTVKQLVKSRKFVLLGCFVVSAIATPPDVISQISLAVPLYILFEGSIIVCRIWSRKRQK